MRKWRVTLPGNRHFEMESDNPSADLIAQGYTEFGLFETTGMTIPENPVAEDQDAQLLTPPQLAALWQIGRDQAYNLCHIPGFPCVRIGRSIRIIKSRLEDWLAENNGGILL